MAEHEDEIELEEEADDELLKNAIPIDQVSPDEQELLDGATPIDEAGGESAPKVPDSIELAETTDAEEPRKIRAFGPTGRHEEQWSRTPNTTGQGAIHVRTFVAKLRLDAIEHLDLQVNEWLDAHPQYDVKFVTTTVGELLGKTREQAMFMNVWV